MLQPIGPAALIDGSILVEEHTLAMPETIQHLTLIEVRQSSTEDDLSGIPGKMSQ